MSDTKKEQSAELPQHLAWLADAPLFIDDTQVTSFYDAVVRPPGRATQQRYAVTDKLAGEIKAKLGIAAEVEVSPGEIIAKLAGLFPSLKAKGEVSSEIEGTGSLEKETENEILIESIHTPQRQLVQLVVHFLLNYTSRVFFVGDLANDKAWRSPETISQSPRELVFLDFPGIEEAQKRGLPPTRLIPTAAEFETKGVIPLYSKIKGNKGAQPPNYPGPVTNDSGKTALKEYWKWFSENYSSTLAMEIVEETAKEGRIRWIDYRLPMSNDGDTIHLHFAPSGKYDTGTFAYNLVKRGYKHGLRIVGTVKSEPDINVLAIYEK